MPWRRVKRKVETGVEERPGVFRLAVPAPANERRVLGRLVERGHVDDGRAKPFTGDGLADTEDGSVTLSLNRLASMKGCDVAAYLTGARDHLDAYDPRAPQTHQRLVELCCAVRIFDYQDDPRYPHWTRQLELLNRTDPTAPLEGTTQDLWDWLTVVHRHDYWNDGEFIPEHIVAVCRIANEIRRRLLEEPATEAPDDVR